MKNFFTNKTVQIVAFILWVVSTVILVLGGVSEAQLSSVLVLVIGGVAGISAIIVAIGKIVNKKE